MQDAITKLPLKSYIDYDKAKELMLKFGKIYKHKTNKNGNMGIIRAIQFHFIDGFIFDTGRKIFIGAKGDYIIQHQEFFEIMKQQDLFEDYCE